MYQNKVGKILWWVVIFRILFNSQWCCSGCDIKKISITSYPYRSNSWNWRSARVDKGQFVKSTFAPDMEFWIRPQHSVSDYQKICLIEIEDTHLWISRETNGFENNVWAHISFKSWHTRNVSSNDHQCLSAAIVNDERVVKQVLKCPKDFESLNFIQQKNIYVNIDADFSFGCDPTEDTAPTYAQMDALISKDTAPTYAQMVALISKDTAPTYAQMVALIVLLSIVLVVIFLLYMAPFIYKIYRLVEEKKSMKGVELGGLLMSERTATMVENNYEEIQSPEPAETPTTPNVKESEQSLKPKSDLEF